MKIKKKELKGVRFTLTRNGKLAIRRKVPDYHGDIKHWITHHIVLDVRELKALQNLLQESDNDN